MLELPVRYPVLDLLEPINLGERVLAARRSRLVDVTPESGVDRRGTSNLNTATVSTSLGFPRSN